MFNNVNTNGDPRSFMYYKGEYYINGTEITLTDEYINTHTFNGKKLWKHARFRRKISEAGYGTTYFFCICKSDWFSLCEMGLDCKVIDDYAPYFVINAHELEYAIESFTKPIKLSKAENEAINKAIEDMIENPKTDWDYPELRVLWVVYIAVMIGSLIFKQFYILWTIASYLFFTWRKDIKK